MEGQLRESEGEIESRRHPDQQSEARLIRIRITLSSKTEGSGAGTPLYRTAMAFSMISTTLSMRMVGRVKRRRSSGLCPEGISNAYD